MNKIYFDHSATTPVDEKVLAAMLPYFSKIYGNASSIHNFGQVAIRAVDDAREVVADFLGTKTNEIYFTSGATESDNLAILGLANLGEHIITTKIEHPAILEAAQEMEKRGVQVTYLPVSQEGLVSVEDVKNAVKENTRLISVMYVNNEIGTIQPIAEIGQWLKELNHNREKRIYFHSDAVQATNYCEMNVDQLGVDMLSLSGHKIYGPKGIGVLYKRAGTPVRPHQFGGHQESSLRPGTLNVPGIVGLAEAIKQVMANKNDSEKIMKMRDRLVKEILAAIPNSQLNGDLINRVPANAHFSFYGVEGESMLILLDQAGMAVSTGSACSSGSLAPSHVLMALGLEPLLAHGSLRITLGKDNTEKEIDILVKTLPPIIEKLRKISPIK
ncbi:MAG: aminotransferase class V-fold PLP-dependent enzyme [Candidatus Buchananbacteria bacterium]